MNNETLQQMVEKLSEEKFGRKFQNQAYFNNKLRTTGGRYLLKSHDIEINPKQFEHYGTDAVVKIILHELCHYHLHIAGKGYQHKDQDFKHLSKQVGAPRFCNSTESYQKRANYEYYCTKCHTKYLRIRKVDTKRMRCGHCNGHLRLKKHLK
ncbi:SprT family protein [Staphylococcus schweitzeri]|uniref:Protein SprT-like n=1 Tax=Staphylococcus schweitzeri TaxID=1654388 RepID=A0A2K4AEU3_9STAP|nr:SprT family protein [Staphylococcus schweitzeri]MBE2129919.1 SprT family protein [Staphylococcus schweitzeri]PNZ48559.1 SprT family protein [Staphylococcus schweitzeri]CDR54619.1 Metallopeptidase%2C SprT family [Staphylococcus schweitzeri]VEE66519.1 SprT-like family [Staphylococcus schweitzeri]